METKYMRHKAMTERDRHSVQVTEPPARAKASLPAIEWAPTGAEATEAVPASLPTCLAATFEFQDIEGRCDVEVTHNFPNFLILLGMLDSWLQATLEAHGLPAHPLSAPRPVN